MQIRSEGRIATSWSLRPKYSLPWQLGPGCLLTLSQLCRALPAELGNTILVADINRCSRTWHKLWCMFITPQTLHLKHHLSGCCSGEDLPSNLTQSVQPRVGHDRSVVLLCSANYLHLPSFTCEIPSFTKCK